MIDSRIMKYLRQFGILMISSALLYCSCSEDDYLQQESTQEAVLPIEDTDVNPLGDTWKVAYTSPTSWSINKSYISGEGVNTDWVTLTTKSRKPGTSEVTIEVKPNISGRDRALKVIFHPGTSVAVNEEFTITQKAARLETSDEIECGWLRDDKELLVESNIRWKISVQHDDGNNTTWLSVPEGEYDNDKNLKVSFNEDNYSGQDHSARIRIVPYKLDNSGREVNLASDVKTSLTREVEVSQSNLVFLINGSAENEYGEVLRFNELGAENKESYQPDGGTPESIELIITSETLWDVEEPDWITYESENEDEDSFTGVVTTRLVLTADQANDSREEKRGTLKLVSQDNDNAIREISVVQEGYEFDLKFEKDEETISSMAVHNEDVAELVVNTKGPWSIDTRTIPDWLQMNTDGLSKNENGEFVGSARIPVSSPEWNLLLEPKKANIYCKSTLNAVDQTLPFEKDPFIFKVGENVDEEEGRSVAKILEKLPMRNTKEYTLMIESSGPWEMTVEETGSGLDWFRVSDSEGVASMPISVMALEPNPDRYNDRGLVLEFSSTLHKEEGSPLSLQIPVTQEKYVFYLGNYNFIVPAYLKAGIQLSTLVSCSYGWTVAQSSGVYVTSDKEGNNPLKSWDDVTYPTIYMNVETNTSKTSKKKTVQITSSLDSEVQTIEIEQDAFVFDVDVSEVPSGNMVYSNNQTYAVSVQSTDEVEWQVRNTGNCDWIVPNAESGTTSKEDLTFTVKPNGNTSPSPRTATFEVYNTVSGESKSFTFKQDAYLFNVTVPTFTDFNELNKKNTSAQQFKVKCSDKWSIMESVPSWLDISATSGDGGGQEVSVDVKPNSNNFTGADRSFTFTVDGSYGGVTHQKEMTVKQKHYVFDVAGVADIVTLNDIAATIKNMSVKSSGSWTAESSNTSVATVSPNKGNPSRETSATCTVSISANYTPDPRVANITVASEDYDSDDSTTSFMKKVITVTQPGYVFEVGGESSYDITSAGVESETVIVECSGEWDVSSPVTIDWLTITKSSNKFTFTVKPNKSDGKKDAPARSAVITVKTTDKSSSNFDPIMITVEQQGEKAPANN